jgi:hypothetical protein
MLKALWRFCEEWAAPFTSAGLAVGIVVALGSVLVGIERNAALIAGVIAGTAAGAAVVLIPTARRWVASNLNMTDGGGWT